MSDLALYRKYRSQDFAQVLGQDHIVQTLKNALASGRVRHAYLFTGPRGVGKTTMARLLAKAVNCLNDNKPCGSCEMCSTELAANTDIIEIDAASNRRIEEMRDLRDKINLAPNLAKYKVYIIDEVHMLTTEAFNALLKTLEEPPAHAIFILATTEAHKVPQTIISRTQQFHFRPIGIEVLEKQLTNIAKREKIAIEPAAVSLLATASRNSFRDAISLLDQLGSLSEEKITVNSARQFLGLSDSALLSKISQAVSNQNAAGVLEALDQALAQGIQPIQLALQLIEHFRNQLTEVLAKGDNSAAIAIANIIESLGGVPKAALPQTILESTLIRLCLEQSRVETTKASQIRESKPADYPKISQTVKKEIQAPGLTVSGELWPKALLVIKSQNNSLYALLCSCQVEVTEDKLLVNSRFSFHRDRLNEPKNRQIIEAALDQTYGRRLAVIAQIEPAKAKVANVNTELVSSALEILGGEVVDG